MIGGEEYKEGESGYWNLWWKGTKFTRRESEGLEGWQRVNHFRGTGLITRKVCFLILFFVLF